jgi:hypothetical protein
MDADALVIRPLQHLFTMDIGKLVIRVEIELTRFEISIFMFAFYFAVIQ